MNASIIPAGIDWQDASEVVASKVFHKKIPASSVDPAWFCKPYDETIKLIKEGKDTANKLALATSPDIISVLDVASKKYADMELDWIAILKRSINRNLLQEEIEKALKKLENGKEVDFSVINELQKSLSTEDEKVARYTVYTAKDALADTSSIPFVIDGMFQKGSVSVIAGEGGSYKTYLLLCSAVSVAMGKPFLGLDTVQSPVLFINEEMSVPAFTRRVGYVLKGLEGDENVPIKFINMAGLNLLGEDDLSLLETEILATGAEYIIIDALSDVMPGGDENSAKDMTKLFLGLRKIASKRDVTIVVIHHLNKEGKYRGSSDIRNKPDNLWEMSHSKDENIIKIDPVKVRDGEPKDIYARIVFEGNGDELIKVYAEAAEQEKIFRSRLSPAEQDVFNIIAMSNEPTTKNEIASKVVACSPTSVGQYIKSLGSKGLICRPEGDGSKGTTAHYITKEKWDELQWTETIEPWNAEAETWSDNNSDNSSPETEASSD